MAKTYVPVDREQLFLLPPDIRDWLPEDHLAWFVIDVVSELDTAALHARHPTDGAGRRAYDPDMMLCLLIYAYCSDELSSRQIERHCEHDLAYRVITANHVPDHTTIARFRSENAEDIAMLFTQVLELCAASGLAKVGVVAVDGTRIAANAARSANKTRAEVDKMLAEAEELDRQEDQEHGQRRGDELPEDLARRGRRAEKLRQVKAEIEKREREAGETEAANAAARAAREEEAASHNQGIAGRKPRTADPLAQAEADLAAASARHRVAMTEYRERRSAARSSGLPEPPRPTTRHGVTRIRHRLEGIKASPRQPPPPPKRPELRLNITDSDSKLMRRPNGWIQGYNAQAAVNEDGIVLAATVSTDHCDDHLCQEMMQGVADNLAAAGLDQVVQLFLFDAGYFTIDNLTAPGPDRLIATKNSSKARREIDEKGFAEGNPPAGASPVQAMEHRLRTDEGARAYGRRQAIVEPVFGDVKHNNGFRQFSRRGLAACRAEWQLVCMTLNITKMFRTRLATTSRT